ncbi:MAG: [NiFe]-hydrogenase assembly chaperone HybE [Magnetococcales bacterium]|nr:[NiFe]-hydrogenase assembly chaperone HybE [Magnetococcales bacterium]
MSTIDLEPGDPGEVEFHARFRVLFEAATEGLRREQVLPGLEADFLNLALGHETRACRHLEGWTLFLQLTPWMLCRVLVPETPRTAIPDGRERVSLPTLGPRTSLTILGQTQEAHTQYDPQLGFFYIQPLVVGLSRYQTGDQVFAAWTDVVRFRDTIRKERSMECRWQQDLTRREIFGSFRLAKG